MSQSAPTEPGKPRGNLAGFIHYFKYDFTSGLLVFLIALPLCLGISIASGYPAIAGVFTAIIGAIITPLISNSELTIKGPAAGLIVIAIGCIEAFGGDGMLGGWTASDAQAYQAALAVGVVAAILQVFFGVFRAGILGEFFPITVVHGMLSAIGVIIIAKQIPVALGVTAAGGPIELLQHVPMFIAAANPAIAAIGIVSILIMFLWPRLGKTYPVLKVLPSPLIVLLFAIPMGMAFDAVWAHSPFLQGHRYQLSDNYLVSMPDRVFGMFDSITLPNFSALQQPKAWQWVFMFFIIGSLESLLSAKAVDIIDPWKRKSNMDRDMVAVGAGNLCCALVGGLPMISEIVRSKANIDNGARTRFANLWHGVFLLVCVALIPMVLHRIPMAALAAMLIYTGFRLAHPNEFMNVLRVGREQFVIFGVTLVAVLATDLLVGIAVGIVSKFAIHISNGVPLRSLFRPELKVVADDGQTVRLQAYKSAVFSNWIPLRLQIERKGLLDCKNVELDLSETELVDHSVMDKLAEMESDFAQQGLLFSVVGLDAHEPFADHAQSARRKGICSVLRVTIIADPQLEGQLVRDLAHMGATGYTAVACYGAGRRQMSTDPTEPVAQIRIEVIAVKEVALTIMDYLRNDLQPHHRLTFCADTVQVARFDAFTPSPAPAAELPLQEAPLESAQL